MSNDDFDTRRFKAIERAGFNRIAERYAEGAHLRRALADALLDSAALTPGQHVLDLASGPGLLARDALERVLPGGRVVASDIAEEMLAEGARRLDSDARYPAAAMSFVAADAERLCLPDARFDRVLAGLALFMFPRPALALAEIRRVLRPGGLVALSVWGTREEVPLIARAQDCIARVLPPPKVARPSVFRFGEPATLEATLQAAGFRDIRIEPCRFTCHFLDAAAYWQGFLDLAGGAAESLSRLPEATQQRLRNTVEAELDACRDPSGSGYAVDALALVASARA